MEIRCEKNDREVLSGGCSSRAAEECRITVPVAVSAYSEVGNVDIRCTGPAVVTRNSSVAPGVPGAVSRFTVSQRIIIDIPLEFRAETDVGEGHVEYASDDNGENGCGCNYGC